MSQTVKLLIVEDDMACASGLKKLVESTVPDAKIEIATTLKGGLKLAQEYKPDVIALDADLPDSGAMETMACIPAFLPALCVVLSGYEEDALILAAFKNGATDFLIKDGNSNAVQRIIFAHFRRLYAPQK